MNHSALLVQVALPVPLMAVFDYLVPDSYFSSHPLCESALLHNTKDQPFPLAGCRVHVPFGNNNKLGVIVAKGCWDNVTDPLKLKAVQHIVDEQPLFDTPLLHTLLWASRYYHHPLGEVFATALPTLLRQGRMLSLLHTFWKINQPQPDDPLYQKHMAGFTLKLQQLNRAPKQKRALELLQLHTSKGAPESVLLLMGATRKQLEALEQRGLISQYQHSPVVQHKPVSLAGVPLTANPEQMHAITRITHSIGRYQAWLLDGLTGSGKTEVYLQAMHPVLAAGKQVLILVPEIGLSPQTIARFQARFSARIYTLNSHMTDVARFSTWEAGYLSQADIIIGTRSAVFAPLPQLGMIIIDEEHDLSFKQHDNFRYHAREIALYRAQQVGCPIIMGTATPSLELIHLVHQQKIQPLYLTTRAGNAQLNRISFVDMRAKKKQAGLVSEVIDAIAATLKRKEKVLVFLNRRGYAPVLLCESCGWQADCPRCDAHLTYHTSPTPHLHCHHCNYQSYLPGHCRQCNSATLVPIGNGTARVEEFLAAQFVEVPLIRVDRDSTKKVGSWDAIYRAVANSNAAILLGTQMLAKGHHFPEVTLVVIVDADAGFYSSDYRAPERAAQIILQVAGRGGRGDKTGRVLIQTWQPDNPLLTTLVSQGYAAFTQILLQERQQLQLPPFRFAALIRAEGLDSSKTEALMLEVNSLFKSHVNTPALEVWGPIPAPMEKRGGKYRWHILILASARKTLHSTLAQVWPVALALPSKRGIRLSIDIDPQSLH